MIESARGFIHVLYIFLLLPLLSALSACSVSDTDDDLGGGNAPDDDRNYAFAMIASDDGLTDYMVGKNGYIKADFDENGALTAVGAYVDEAPIVVEMDDNGVITRIVGEPFDIIFRYAEDYCDIIARYANLSYSERVNVGYAEALSENERHGRSRAGVGERLHDTLKSKFNTAVVTRGLQKGIEAESNSKNGALNDVLDNYKGGNLNDFVDLVEGIRDRNDMTMLDIVEDFNSKLPQMGGAEYLFYTIFQAIPATQWINDWIFPIIRGIQDHNAEIAKMRAENSKLPLYIFGIGPDGVDNVDDESATCRIDGLLMINSYRKPVDIEYGICWSEGVPTMASGCQSIAYSDPDYGESISIQMPVSFEINGLKPSTRYYYRAFMRDNSTGQVLYSDVDWFNTRDPFGAKVSRVEVDDCWLAMDDLYDEVIKVSADVEYKVNEEDLKARYKNIVDYGVMVGGLENAEASFKDNPQGKVRLEFTLFTPNDEDIDYFACRAVIPFHTFNYIDYIDEKGVKQRILYGDRSWEAVYDRQPSLELIDIECLDFQIGHPEGYMGIDEAAGLYKVRFRIDGYLFVNLIGETVGDWSKGSRNFAHMGGVTFFSDKELLEATLTAGSSGWGSQDNNPCFGFRLMSRDGSYFTPFLDRYLYLVVSGGCFSGLKIIDGPCPDPSHPGYDD